MPPMRPPRPRQRPGAGPPRPAPDRGAAPSRAPARPVAANRSSAFLAAGLVALFILSFGAILFVMYRLFIADSSTASVPETAPAANLVLPPGARVFTSLSEFERGGSLPAGQPFALRISEAELNARIEAEMRKQSNLPIRNVTSTILDDKVRFNGLVRAAGVELNTTVDVRFKAEAGRLAYDILAINFGPVPVPGIARQAITDTIDRQIGQQKLTEPYILDSIQLRPGEVAVVGRPR